MHNPLKARLAQTLHDWIAINSVTPHEAAFLGELQRVFEARGYHCTRRPLSEDRWNLLATRAKGATPRLLYSTHVDTVPPFIAPRIEGDRVYGRGACDTKGGLLAMIKAADRLDDPDVGFLLVVGEEVDHAGAKHEAAQPMQGVSRIILCEPTVNRVVRAQKGMIRVGARAEGVAAHSAYPARGDSALHRMIAALHELLSETPWSEDEVLGATTLNVGHLEGGVAANVFAPLAEAQILIRTVRPTREYLPILESVGRAHRVTLDVLVGERPGAL